MRDQYDLGYLRSFAMLGEQIADVDDTAGTVLDKRCGQAARRKWDVIIGEDVPEEQKATAALHQEALKYAFSNLRTRNAVELDQRGGMTLLLQQMMRAAFYRYTAHEVAWLPSAGGLTAELWHVPLAFFENTRGQIRYSGPFGSTPGRELDPANWLIGVHHRCLMKSMAVLYLFKKLSLSDWVNFSEKFGMPGLHLETTATPGTKEWNEAVDALAAFSRDWALVTTKEQKVNLIQASMSGDGPFAPMVDRCDRAMSRVALGSDLATMSRENGAGASLQSEETDELVSADCDWLSETINETLSRRVIEYHFGLGTIPLAYFKLLGPQRQDTKLEMEVDKHVKDFGVNLSADDIAERYGRTHAVTAPVVAPVVAAVPAASPAPIPPAANEKVPVPAVLNARQTAQKEKVKAALKRALKQAAQTVEGIGAANDPAAALAELDLEALAAEMEEAGDVDDLEEAFAEIIAAEFLAGLTTRERAAAVPAANDESGTPSPSILTAANDIVAARFQVSATGIFMPFGEYPHGVGLQIVDAQAGQRMAADLASFFGRARRLFAGAPVYVGHPDHHEASIRALFPDARARGWCRSVEVQSDGLHFPVKWNTLGKGELEDGQYAFHSPYWALERVTTAAGRAAVRPIRLLSIGLTNTPNIKVPSIIS